MILHDKIKISEICRSTHPQTRPNKSIKNPNLQRFLDLSSPLSLDLSSTAFLRGRRRSPLSLSLFRRCRLRSPLLHRRRSPLRPPLSPPSTKTLSLSIVALHLDLIPSLSSAAANARSPLLRHRRSHLPPPFSSTALSAIDEDSLSPSLLPHLDLVPSLSFTAADPLSPLQVVEVLNPLAREYKSVGTMKKELAQLQQELTQAHRQVHISEARVDAALDKLAYMETLVNDKLLQDKNTNESSSDRTALKPSTSSASQGTIKTGSRRRNLNVSGPVKPYHPSLKNFWYPVAFSGDLKDDTMIPIDCFEEPWVIFRGKDGKPGCLQNTCAHRACPLHLGSVNEGRIQCPYHGWEYSTDGKCEKMPSTRMLNVRIRSLPCFEHEGMVWIWPGDAPPLATLPSLQPPPGFIIHAEIVMELPVEHGLLLDNLLDLAHAPFTHTSTFAKGWSVPSLVKFLTPASGLQGYWDPYPIEMEFRPPCMVLSTIGISKPGKLEGQNTRQCSTHLHQLHVCLPSSRGKTRLLYRMSLDFAPILKHVPFMHILWRHFAEKVLNEDLRLVLGQQDRMINGANVWNLPVTYDKLGVRYRLWRDALERGAKQLPFSKQDE